MSNVDQPGPEPSPPPPPPASPPRNRLFAETWTLGLFSLLGLIGFIATFVLILVRSPDAQGPRALTAEEIKTLAGKPGPPGERGALGPPGPRGPAGEPGVRILRVDCTPTSCTATCAADEVLINAYCGPNHAAAVFPTEISAACRAPARGRLDLVAACAKAPRR